MHKFRSTVLVSTFSLFLLLCHLNATKAVAQAEVSSATVVLKANLITVTAPPRYEKYANVVLGHATAALRYLNSQAGDALYIPIAFEVIPTRKEFLQRAGGEGENSLAVSLGNQSRILISVPAMSESAADKVRQVLVHELAHVYLDAKTDGPVPRWVHEGVAQALAGEWTEAPGEGYMALAAYTGGLIPLNKLVRTFPQDQVSRNMAYAQSYSVIRYLVRSDFGNSLALFLKAIRGQEGKEYLKSLSGGIELESIDYRWREELKSPKFLSAIALSSGFLWGTAALLVVVAFFIKRRRSKAIRAQWAREEMMAAEYGSMNVPHADTTPPWDPDNETPPIDYLESDESWHAEDNLDEADGESWRERY